MSRLLSCVAAALMLGSGSAAADTVLLTRPAAGLEQAMPSPQIEQSEASPLLPHLPFDLAPLADAGIADLNGQTYLVGPRSHTPIVR